MFHGVMTMNRKKQSALYLASAGIPCISFLLALMLIDAVPFGSNSILISDACGQYMDFLSHWKTVLSGENDLFYTFSKNMGGDMLNLAAYYLLSPFNLLFLFSSTKTLPLVYTMVVALKLSLCGLTFFHASRRLYGIKASGLLFSSAYALMAYNMLYGWNAMWLDGVIILPLLVLGLHRILEGGRPWLYCLSLFYGLVTNFYIGYMLCITAVILFAGELFGRSCPLGSLPRHVGRFCTASLIGGLGAAPVWLPTFLSLAAERTQTNTTQFLLARNFTVYGFLPKLLSGAASVKEMAGGTPHVFCGTLVLLLVFLFLLSPSIALRKRIAAAGILLAVFVSFYLQPLNIVWHGFSANNSFNYRYAFIFSFFLISTAQYLFRNRTLISRKAVLMSGGLILAAFVLAIGQRRGFSHDVGSAVSLAVLVVSVLVLAFRPNRRVCLIIVGILSFLELGINCALSWQVLVTYPEMVEQTGFESFVSQTEPAVQYVKDRDSGFYRMEKNFHRTINDASLFSYNGLSHFSSTEPVFTKQFMRKMGFFAEYNFWAWYGDGSTAEADSLLGVKYLLSREDLSGKKDYSLLTEINGIKIYQNENALPAAMLCNDDIASVSMAEPNLYALHNTVWQRLTGQSGNILLPAESSVTTENLTIHPSAEGYTRYEKEDPAQDAWIRYEIPIAYALPVSLYFTAPDDQRAELYIDGSLDGIYFDEGRWNMTGAGTYAPGEALVVELRLMDNELRIQDALFYYENAAVLSRMAASIQANAPQLTRLSGSRFEGSFTAPDNQLLVFTIPYNEGWQLQIDGVDVPCQTVMDVFLAAQISAGSHSFTLRYTPKGLYPGCGLSLTALCLAGLWFCLRKKHSEK